MAGWVDSFRKVWGWLSSPQGTPRTSSSRTCLKGSHIVTTSVKGSHLLSIELKGSHTISTSLIGGSQSCD